ncbi:MAG: hypothetical protein J1E06_07875 [Acutalibacter sp.]|nr:hypothetical protein [Acutalibacter sp.]
MKRIVLLLLSAVLLLLLSACGDDFSLTEGLSPAFQPESAQESVSEGTPSVPAIDVEDVPSQVESQLEDESLLLPPMVRVRWQAGEFSAMLQLPESGLTAFWECADDLLVEVDRREDAPNADPFYDPLVSSPYYSGQEALLEDLFRFSDELPQRFYWIDEDTVRAAWEIGTYLSVTCQDRVAHFDWSGQNSENLEVFDLFLAMSPEKELPDYDGNARYRYTPEGEWKTLDEHPGFELLQVTGEMVVQPFNSAERLLARGTSMPDFSQYE